MEPSTHGSDGRQADGRFAQGNRLGRGNPLAGRAAKIRAVLLRRFTPKAAAEIVDCLIDKAKKGDLAAIRELLDRTIGKPTQAVEIAQTEAPAGAEERPHKTLAELFAPLLGKVPLALPPGVPQPHLRAMFRPGESGAPKVDRAEEDRPGGPLAEPGRADGADPAGGGDSVKV